jgi:hypothetical protein
MKSNNQILRLISFLLMALNMMRTQEPEYTSSSSGPDPIFIANEYIHSHLEVLGLTTLDIAYMTVDDIYTDEASAITRIDFLQHYKDIPVYDALLRVKITREGKVFQVENKFVAGLKEKINTTIPVIRPDQAVADLAAYLNITYTGMQLKNNNGASSFIFAKNDMVNQDIPVELNLQPYEGKAFLVWDVLFAPSGTTDLWSARIDAVTGIVLDEDNRTVRCLEENKFINSGS